MDTTGAEAPVQAADGAQMGHPPAEAMAQPGSPEEREGVEAAITQSPRETERTLVSVDALIAAYEALGQEALFVVQSCFSAEPML